MRPMAKPDNILPLHRGIRPIPPRDLNQIFRIPGRSDPVDLYGGAKPEAYRADVRSGFGEAIADFVCDVRFLAGFYVGTMLLSALAFVTVLL
jgi:hypothetical protein